MSLGPSPSWRYSIVSGPPAGVVVWGAGWRWSYSELGLGILHPSQAHTCINLQPWEGVSHYDLTLWIFKDRKTWVTATHLQSACPAVRAARLLLPHIPAWLHAHLHLSCSCGSVLLQKPELRENGTADYSKVITAPVHGESRSWKLGQLLLV